jgi:hypothetical protein
MNKESLQEHIEKLNVAIDQQTGNLNVMIGKRNAYKEILAKMWEEELNTEGEESASNEIQSAEKSVVGEESEAS